MAQAVGSTKPILGSVDTFGGHYYSPLDYSGPASYVQGGDSISPASFGMYNNIQTLVGSIDQSGKFMAVPRPLANGVTQWQLIWISLTTATVGGQAQTAGTEAATGTNLSTFTVRLSAIGY